MTLQCGISFRCWRLVRGTASVALSPKPYVSRLGRSSPTSPHLVPKLQDICIQRPSSDHSYLNTIALLPVVFQSRHKVSSWILNRLIDQPHAKSCFGTSRDLEFIRIIIYKVERSLRKF